MGLQGEDPLQFSLLAPKVLTYGGGFHAETFMQWAASGLTLYIYIYIYIYIEIEQNRLE